MKDPFAINLEYGALRFFCALVNAVPYGVACALARLIAVAAFDLLRFQRRRTLARIAGVFPEKSPRERRAIARASLANVLMTGVEMMRAPRLKRAWFDRHVVGGAESEARLSALADEGRGVVILVPHSGNWYMAAWTMAAYGLPLFSIAAAQRNPKINAWMRRQYGTVEILDRRSAASMFEIKRRLSEGRAFAILPDLRVRFEDTQVGFLRGTANVSHGAAMFAVNAGAPIVVGAMRREKGRHVVEYLAELRPDPQAADAHAEARRLTREAFKILDDFVLSHPGDWYWFNKRWILEPPQPK